MAPNISKQHHHYVTMEVEDSYAVNPPEGPAQEESDNTVFRAIPLLERLQAALVRLDNMMFEERRQLIEDMRAAEFSALEVENIVSVMQAGSFLGPLLLQEFGAEIEEIQREARERTLAANLGTVDQGLKSGTTMEN